MGGLVGYIKGEPVPASLSNDLSNGSSGQGEPKLQTRGRPACRWREYWAMNLIPSLHMGCIRRESEPVACCTVAAPQSLTHTVISARSFGESCHGSLSTGPVLSHSARKINFIASEAVAQAVLVSVGCDWIGWRTFGLRVPRAADAVDTVNVRK